MDIRFFSERSFADMWQRFRYAEVCVSLHDRGTYAVGSSFACLSWTHGPEGPRFMSAGRFRWRDVKDFRKGRRQRQRTMHPETVCYLPWTFLEIESGDDLWESAQYTTSLLDEMRVERIDTDAMHVRYSGNTSLWIGIPASLMGHPVGTVEDQKTLRQRVFRPFTRQRLDEGFFDGRGLHRLLGSTHSEGSCTRIIPKSALRSRSAFEEALSSGETFPEPIRQGPRCEALTRRCRRKTQFHVPACGSVKTDTEGGALMRETEGGVEEGQRNDVAFRRACVLWRRYDRRGAWTELQDWNQKNSPPLPKRELESCFESARRKAQT
jgi:hypothetical protein